MRANHLALFIAAAVLVFARSATAGHSGYDVYRLGNASNPKLENVRPVKDADIFKKGGHDWVKGKSKGVSTFKHPQARKGDREWKLPAGASYPDALHPVNDHDDHVSWQASHDMPLSDYVQALRDLGLHFRKNF